MHNYNQKLDDIKRMLLIVVVLALALLIWPFISAVLIGGDYSATPQKTWENDEIDQDEDAGLLSYFMDDREADSYASLIKAITDGREGRAVTIVLTDNIKVPAGNTVLIPDNKLVTIDGDGYTIVGTDAQSVITVLGMLTVRDTVITHRDGDIGPGVTVDPGGIFNLESGLITMNIGSGVLNYGSFTMTGGRIADNLSSGNGGGVNCEREPGAVYPMSFSMTGGAISDNSARNGGGVYYDAWSAMLSVTGGIISENSASGNGGGLFISGLHNTGYISISGEAIISGNAADNGGGIYNDSELSLAGHTVISGNKAANGGGLYGGRSLFKPGSASYNTTYSNISVSENVIISGNSARYGGGVYTWDYDRFRTSGDGVRFFDNHTTGGTWIVKESSDDFFKYNANIRHERQIWSDGLEYGYNNRDINYLIKPLPLLNMEVQDIGSDAWKSGNTAEAGTVVRFKLITVVPFIDENMVFEPIYRIYVASDHEFSFNNDISVTVEGIEFYGYALLPDTGLGYTFAIDFNTDSLQELIPGLQIEVTYSATLNRSAQQGDIGIDNKAYLEYQVEQSDGSSSSVTDVAVTTTAVKAAG